MTSHDAPERRRGPFDRRVPGEGKRAASATRQFTTILRTMIARQDFVTLLDLDSLAAIRRDAPDRCARLSKEVPPTRLVGVAPPRNHQPTP